MDDDLSVAAAFAVVHDTVRAGNAALTAQDVDAASAAIDAVLAMLDVFGLNPYAEPWASQGGAGRETEVIDSLVRVLLEQRAEARGRKDFATADAIRDGLDAIGIKVEDTHSGARWTLER